MSVVILACSSLLPFVEAAQKKMNTNYPVVTVDRALHVEPADMKAAVAEKIGELCSGGGTLLPKEDGTSAQQTDPASLTVLVAMGFCGGTWDHVSFPCRVVIPRVDDCISLLLTCTDDYCPNRKELGHLYLYENDPADFSALKLIRDGGTADPTYRGMSQADLFRYWFSGYHAMDIIDTGLNPCYEVPYVEAAQKEADVINADLGYAQGSTLLLEKLVSGRWDDQFLVLEPGEPALHSKFFE